MAMKWKFWKKRKADAKNEIAAVGMAVKEPITDRIEPEHLENKIKQKDSDPITRKEAMDLAVVTLDTISDQITEIRSEWTGIQKSLKEGIEENKEKINNEFENFQKQTTELLKNLAVYFEDKQEQDKDIQQKDRETQQNEREAARSEIEIKVKELADKAKEVTDSIDHRSEELSDSVDKRFSEFAAKLDSELDKSKSELEEFSKRSLALERRLQQQLMINENRMKDMSAEVDAQRKRVDDLLETMSKFIEDHKESMKASTNIHRTYLMMLDLFNEIMASKGVPCSITEAYIAKKISETVDNNLKEIQFLISKTKMEQETMERIRFEADAKEKRTSH